MVLENIHWADAATLDRLTYLGRRIENSKALILTTYRGDEIGPDHQLWPVLGDLLTKPHIHRHTVGSRGEVDNGVLTVTVPMREESKPRKVSIQTSNREVISASVSS